MKSRKLIIFLSIIVLIFVFYQSAFAASFELKYPIIPLAPDINQLDPSQADLPAYVLYFFYLIVYLSGFISLVVLAIGALNYFGAGENVSKMVDAKHQIISALIGLGIMLGSYTILYNINPQLTILNFHAPEKIEYAKLEHEDTPEKFQSQIYTEIPIGRIIERIFEIKIVKEGSPTPALGPTPSPTPSPTPTPLLLPSEEQAQKEESEIPRMTRIDNVAHNILQLAEKLKASNNSLQSLSESCSCDETNIIDSFIVVECSPEPSPSPAPSPSPSPHARNQNNYLENKIGGLSFKSLASVEPNKEIKLCDFSNDNLQKILDDTNISFELDSLKQEIEVDGKTIVKKPACWYKTKRDFLKGDSALEAGALDYTGRAILKATIPEKGYFSFSYKSSARDASCVYGPYEASSLRFSSPHACGIDIVQPPKATVWTKTTAGLYISVNGNLFYPQDINLDVLYSGMLPHSEEWTTIRVLAEKNARFTFEFPYVNPRDPCFYAIVDNFQFISLVSSPLPSVSPSPTPTYGCNCDPCKKVRSQIIATQKDIADTVSKGIEIKQKDKDGYERTVKTSLMEQQSKAEREIRLIKDEIEKMNRLESFMIECGLSNLMTLSDFLEMSNEYQKQKWIIDYANFWDYIKVKDDWATFYCPVSGTLWENMDPLKIRVEDLSQTSMEKLKKEETSSRALSGYNPTDYEDLLKIKIDEINKLEKRLEDNEEAEPDKKFLTAEDIVKIQERIASLKATKEEIEQNISKLRLRAVVESTIYELVRQLSREEQGIPQDGTGERLSAEDINRMQEELVTLRSLKAELDQKIAEDDEDITEISHELTETKSLLNSYRNLKFELAVLTPAQSETYNSMAEALRYKYRNNPEKLSQIEGDLTNTATGLAAAAPSTLPSFIDQKIKEYENDIYELQSLLNEIMQKERIGGNVGTISGEYNTGSLVEGEIAVACNREIPVGELLDRSRRVAYKIVERLEKLISLTEDLIKKTSDMETLISQCSSKRCTPSCLKPLTPPLQNQAPNCNNNVLGYMQSCDPANDLCFKCGRCSYLIDNWTTPALDPGYYCNDDDLAVPDSKGYYQDWKNCCTAPYKCYGGDCVIPFTGSTSGYSLPPYKCGTPQTYFFCKYLDACLSTETGPACQLKYSADTDGARGSGLGFACGNPMNQIFCNVDYPVCMSKDNNSTDPGAPESVLSCCNTTVCGNWGNQICCPSGKESERVSCAIDDEGKPDCCMSQNDIVCGNPGNQICCPKTSFCGINRNNDPFCCYTGLGRETTWLYPENTANICGAPGYQICCPQVNGDLKKQYCSGTSMDPTCTNDRNYATQNSSAFDEICVPIDDDLIEAYSLLLFSSDQGTRIQDIFKNFNDACKNISSTRIGVLSSGAVKIHPLYLSGYYEGCLGCCAPPNKVCGPLSLDVQKSVFTTSGACCLPDEKCINSENDPRCCPPNSVVCGNRPNAQTCCESDQKCGYQTPADGYSSAPDVATKGPYCVDACPEPPKQTFCEDMANSVNSKNIVWEDPIALDNTIPYLAPFRKWKRFLVEGFYNQTEESYVGGSALMSSLKNDKMVSLAASTTFYKGDASVINGKFMVKGPGILKFYYKTSAYYDPSKIPFRVTCKVDNSELGHSNKIMDCFPGEITLEPSISWKKIEIAVPDVDQYIEANPYNGKITFSFGQDYWAYDNLGKAVLISRSNSSDRFDIANDDCVFIVLDNVDFLPSGTSGCEGDPCPSQEIKKTLEEIIEIVEGKPNDENAKKCSANLPNGKPNPDYPACKNNKEKEGIKDVVNKEYNKSDNKNEMEQIGLRTIIKEIVPSIYEELNLTRESMKTCFSEPGGSSIAQSCELVKNQVGPDGKLIKNCCYKECYIQDCLASCYLLKERGDYNNCLFSCLAERQKEEDKNASKVGALGVQDIDSCRHSLNFYCCTK